MTAVVSDNKRIAKNTISLYLRTFIVLLVSLYISRALLQILGETDLGIYNVVGGIVFLLSVFQASLTKSIQRFITFDIGSNFSTEQKSKTFSSCLFIIVILAGISIVLGETLGLSIVNYLTDIPYERRFAANMVYQFTLLSFVFILLNIPLDAVIIAHEKMSAYALFTIIESVLRLITIFILMNSGSDKLVIYALLHSSVSVLMIICYYAYVKVKFPIYRLRLIWESKICKQILSFSGWTLFGSSTNVLTQQGVSLLFNNFVGLVANTALGFASQVNGALTRFVGNFSTAFNPQVIKLYAQKDFSNLFILIYRASKFSFALSYIMALPLIANMDFILDLWLGKIPLYTIEFCILILICSVIDATTGVFNTAITATGKIKRYQILISISFLLDFFVALSLLLFHLNPIIVFGSRIVTRGIINMIIGLLSIKREMSFRIVDYLKSVGIPIILTIVLTLPTAFIPKYLFVNKWVVFSLSSLLSIIAIAICTLMLIMNSNERLRIKSLLFCRIEKLTKRF